MSGKIGWIALIIAGVVAVYFIVFATQSVQVSLTNQAVTTINTTSPGNYGDAKAFLTYWPIIVMIIPGAIGLIWIAVILRRKTA